MSAGPDTHGPALPPHSAPSAREDPPSASSTRSFKHLPSSCRGCACAGGGADTAVDKEATKSVLTELPLPRAEGTTRRGSVVCGSLDVIGGGVRERGTGGRTVAGGRGRGPWTGDTCREEQIRSAPRKAHPLRAGARRASPPPTAPWPLHSAGPETRSRGPHLNRWVLARREAGKGVSSGKERKGSRRKGPRPAWPLPGREDAEAGAEGGRGRDSGGRERQVEGRGAPGPGADARAVALAPGETGATGLPHPHPTPCPGCRLRKD